MIVKGDQKTVAISDSTLDFYETFNAKHCCH